jgi:hypothetical protein
MLIVKRIERNAEGIRYELEVDGEIKWHKFIAFAGHRRRFFLEAAREQETRAKEFIDPTLNKIPV